jgi:phage terminase large subunit-like protein
MLRAEWNDAFLEELRLFPNGTYKDQVDGGSGAFTKLAVKKRVGALRPEKENTRRKH